MQTMTETRLTRTPEEVAQIADPKERVRVASEILDTAEETRALRDIATIVARYDHNVPPVKIWRETLGVSRGLYNRIMQRAPTDAERVKILKANPPLAKDPLTVAKAAQEKVNALDEIRRIRADTALALMAGRAYHDGERVPPVPNADVARLTGLSTARVAQIRNETR